jgi:Tfp pilus assembly protein PilF
MPDMARPRVENYELVVKTSGLASRELVELCAPCHSRRAALGDYTHAEPDLLDSLLPSLLTDALYFSDGQILDEVYVYGSFTQSRMYHRDVRCSDCHDVHSVKLLKEGNDLCLQCHRASAYDTYAHHFHKKKGEEGKPILSADGEVLFEVGTGADCVGCHMPGRVYMGIDYRVDHSLRIPRPDLSMALGTPNACNRCHVDKTDKWSEDYMTKWYGPGRRPHYGTTLEAGRRADPGAHQDLIRLAGDALYPVIVRSTALTLLTAYPGEETDRAFRTALMDEEALIRRTAVNSIQLPDQAALAALMIPILYDPVQAVRMEAANRLVEAPDRQLKADEQKVFQAALDEFERSMQYSGDFAFGRFNLGNLYVALGRPEEAVRQYKAAIKIDALTYPAKVNLAMLYNDRGEQAKAETLLREVVKDHPEEYEMAYSLGLLLAEQEKFDEAARFLEKAAAGLPAYPRIHYNLGLLLQRLGRDAEAEASLIRALDLASENLDYLYALADYYLKRERYREAKSLAERMIAAHPSERIGHDLIQLIESRMRSHTP